MVLPTSTSFVSVVPAYMQDPAPPLPLPCSLFCSLMAARVLRIVTRCQLSPNGSGWAILKALQHSGRVAVSDFCQWFALEQQALQLSEALETHFGASHVQRVFRQGTRHRCAWHRSPLSMT